jgi:Glyoxalase-like domain
MPLEWEQVVVHSADPVALGQWWADALGWVVVSSSADELEIRPQADRLPALEFVRLDESKTAKSRLHLDLRPDDQATEVARLVAHGAQRVDIGQGDQSWVVLADPEGNEFCVLGQRRPQAARAPGPSQGR